MCVRLVADVPRDAPSAPRFVSSVQLLLDLCDRPFQLMQLFEQGPSPLLGGFRLAVNRRVGVGAPSPRFSSVKLLLDLCDRPFHVMQLFEQGPSPGGCLRVAVNHSFWFA
eukprot:3825845-Prymnesium_polylepis.2